MSQGKVKVLGFSSKHAFLFNVRKIVLRRKPSLAEELSIDPLTMNSDEWANKISADAHSESVKSTPESVKDTADSFKAPTENAIFTPIGAHDQFETARGAGELKNKLSVDDSSEDAPSSASEKKRSEISNDEEKFESKTSSERTVSSSEKAASATESDNTMTLTNSDRTVSMASSEKTAGSSNESSSNIRSKKSASLVNSGKLVSTSSSTKTLSKHKEVSEAILVQVTSDPNSESAWFHPSQDKSASDDESAHLTNTNDSREESAWFQKPKDKNKSEKQRDPPPNDLGKEESADHSDDDASLGVSEGESPQLTVTDGSSASNAWFHSRSKSECNSNSGSFKLAARTKSRASSGTPMSRHTSRESPNLTEVETPTSSRASSGGVYYSANLGSRGGSGGSGGSGERITSKANSSFRSNTQTTSSANNDGIAMPRAVSKKMSLRKSIDREPEGAN